MTMTRHELEFAISQYLDGTLPPLETAALEERLASDAEARAVLDEYRALDRALKTSLPALPDVAWDRLSAHLSDLVARKEAPVRHLRLPAIVRTVGMALAACVAVVFGILFVINRSGPTPELAVTEPRDVVAIVVGPQPERAPQQAQHVAQISIGPAPTMSDSWRYADTVVSRPTVVMIDRAASPVQDTDLSPF